ncbi:hypothetical protein [Streptomyces sp. KR80]|uniref:hypothetical protein n=1 Tax=Streptomyces sp. KR80 TaxID=3457426 RepID=UPI003FD49D18
MSSAAASTSTELSAAKATTYKAHMPYKSKGRIYAKGSIKGTSNGRKICVQLWFTDPPTWPQGPVTAKKCMSGYLYGSGWYHVSKQCGGEGLYFTKAWFYNRSGKLVAKKTSKLKPIRC